MIKKLIASLYLALILSPVALFAVSPSQIGTNACTVAGSDSLGCGNKGILGANSIFESVIYVVIGVIASISVLMIVIGGLRYVLSGGDSNGIKSAKDTIIYALVGLVVSLLAGAIVRFVIGAIK